MDRLSCSARPQVLILAMPSFSETTLLLFWKRHQLLHEGLKRGLRRHELRAMPRPWLMKDPYPSRFKGRAARERPDPLCSPMRSCAAQTKHCTFLVAPRSPLLMSQAGLVYVEAQHMLSGLDVKPSAKARPAASCYDNSSLT